MELINKNELRLRKAEVIERIKQGAIFIHPTDTIYGIGCNALNNKAIKKIRKLKDRFDKPFSIWAPNLNWIKENCQPSKQLDGWLNKLPGQYTLITNLKNDKKLPSSLTLNTNSLGIRMPSHWFHEIVQALDFPIVTTSANKTGEGFMTSLDNLHPEIKREIDFIIYEGEKKARPSKLINLIKEEEIIER